MGVGVQDVILFNVGLRFVGHLGVGEGEDFEDEVDREREQHNLFRGGLVFKAHRRLYQSTLGLRVIKKNNNWADASKHETRHRDTRHRAT